MRSLRCRAMTSPVRGSRESSAAGSTSGSSSTTGGRSSIHLRMSGRLRLGCRECEAKYARLILRLGKKMSIYFVDPRRLGTAELYEDGFDVPVGIEPLSEDFTPAALAKLASSSRAPIKGFLLDQKRIAGIGNIYAAESLWRAKLDPRRKANELSRAEVGRLHKAIVGVLERSGGRPRNDARNERVRLPPDSDRDGIVPEPPRRLRTRGRAVRAVRRRD